MASRSRPRPNAQPSLLPAPAARRHTQRHTKALLKGNPQTTFFPVETGSIWVSLSVGEHCSLLTEFIKLLNGGCFVKYNKGASSCWKRFNKWWFSIGCAPYLKWVWLTWGLGIVVLLCTDDGVSSFVTKREREREMIECKGVTIKSKMNAWYNPDIWEHIKKSWLMTYFHS